MSISDEKSESVKVFIKESDLDAHCTGLKTYQWNACIINFKNSKFHLYGNKEKAYYREKKSLGLALCKLFYMGVRTINLSIWGEGSMKDDVYRDKIEIDRLWSWETSDSANNSK